MESTVEREHPMEIAVFCSLHFPNPETRHKSFLLPHSTELGFPPAPRRGTRYSRSHSSFAVCARLRVSRPKIARSQTTLTCRRIFDLTHIAKIAYPDRNSERVASEMKKGKVKIEIEIQYTPPHLSVIIIQLLVVQIYTHNFPCASITLYYASTIVIQRRRFVTLAINFQFLLNFCLWFHWLLHSFHFLANSLSNEHANCELWTGSKLELITIYARTVRHLFLLNEWASARGREIERESRGDGGRL